MIQQVYFYFCIIKKSEMLPDLSLPYSLQGKQADAKEEWKMARKLNFVVGRNDFYLNVITIHDTNLTRESAWNFMWIRSQITLIIFQLFCHDLKGWVNFKKWPFSKSINNSLILVVLFTLVISWFHLPSVKRHMVSVSLFHFLSPMCTRAHTHSHTYSYIHGM